MAVKLFRQRAVIYCSILPGQDRLYLDYQEKNLIVKIQKLDIEVTSVIKDCADLNDSHRFAITQLKVLAQKKRIDLIIVQSLKRLFNSEIDILNFKAFMEYHHVHILAI